MFAAIRRRMITRRRWASTSDVSGHLPGPSGAAGSGGATRRARSLRRPPPNANISERATAPVVALRLRARPKTDGVSVEGESVPGGDGDGGDGGLPEASQMNTFGAVSPPY